MEKREDYTVDPAWLEGTVKELDKLVKKQEKIQLVVAQLQFANTTLNYCDIFKKYGTELLTIEDVIKHFKDSTGCQNVIVYPFGPRH